VGLLFGGHLGGELLGGKIPAGNGESIGTSAVASGGFAYGADLGLRFARHWYVGGILEHAAFAQGNRNGLARDVSVSSDTTDLGVTFAFIGNPDWTSFYGELGVANRWLHYKVTGAQNPAANETVFAPADHTDHGAEFTLGAGVWIPVGRSVRLLPKATLGIGTFSQPDGDDSTTALWHTFFMIGVAGFYNHDF
jgi:hypothetical protein